MDDATFNDLIQIYYEDDNALRHLWRKYMNRQWDLPPGVTNRMIEEHFGDSDCCEDCFVTSTDNGYGVAEPEGCSDESCTCHWTKDDWKQAKGEAQYEANRDDKD